MPHGASYGVRCPAGAQRVFGLRHRYIPQSHDAVADEFIDRAAFLVNRFGRQRQEFGQKRSDLRPVRLGEFGEVRQIGEHHGDVAQLPAGFRIDALLYEAAYDVGGNIEAECAQAARHPFQRSRKLVEFGKRRRDVTDFLQ